MDCKNAGKMISQYIDDELKPDEKAAFVLHIRDCAACKERLEEIRTVHEMFAAAERFSAPYGFATRVLANLQERESSRVLPGLKHFFLRTAEVAFALAIVSIGAISGNLMVAHKTPPATQTSVQETFSLDLFQATPPGSIGDLYASMMGAGDER